MSQPNQPMRQWNNQYKVFLKMDPIMGLMVECGGYWIAWSECSDGTKAVKRGLVRKNARGMPDDMYYAVFGPPPEKSGDGKV